MYQIKEQKGTEEPRLRATYDEGERTQMYDALDAWHDSADMCNTKVTVWHNGRIFSSYDRRPKEHRE